MESRWAYEVSHGGLWDTAEVGPPCATTMIYHDWVTFCQRSQLFIEIITLTLGLEGPAEYSRLINASDPAGDRLPVIKLFANCTSLEEKFNKGGGLGVRK